MKSLNAPNEGKLEDNSSVGVGHIGPLLSPPLQEVDRFCVHFECEAEMPKHSVPEEPFPDPYSTLGKGGDLG